MTPPEDAAAIDEASPRLDGLTLQELAGLDVGDVRRRRIAVILAGFIA